MSNWFASIQDGLRNAETLLNAVDQKAKEVVGMLDAPILGKFTPVIQVTDTGIARPLKFIAEQE